MYNLLNNITSWWKILNEWYIYIMCMYVVCTKNINVRGGSCCFCTIFQRLYNVYLRKKKNPPVLYPSTYTHTYKIWGCFMKNGIINESVWFYQSETVKKYKRHNWLSSFMKVLLSLRPLLLKFMYGTYLSSNIDFLTEIIKLMCCDVQK